MALKPADLDKICGDGGALNDKLALTLSKYLFKAFDLIAYKDQSKFFHYEIINLVFYFRTSCNCYKWLTFT